MNVGGWVGGRVGVHVGGWGPLPHECCMPSMTPIPPATRAAPPTQVMSERLSEHDDPQVQLELKAFIDGM